MEKPVENNNASIDNQSDETWIKPEVVSFAPVKAAEGISYRPTDGISNLTV